MCFKIFPLPEFLLPAPMIITLYTKPFYLVLTACAGCGDNPSFGFSKQGKKSLRRSHDSKRVHFKLLYARFHRHPFDLASFYDTGIVYKGPQFYLNEKQRIGFSQSKRNKTL